MKTPKCNCKPFDSHFEFQHEQRTTVICKDKGSKPKYIYDNRSSDYLTKYRVDGGLIDNSGAKCDYLLLNCNKSQSFFIELKGSDIIHAIEQIDRSIDLLKDKLAGLSVFARIVVTRVNTPVLKDTRYLRLKKKVESLNGNLSYKSKELTDINFIEP
jgi:hypothetical protein